MAECNLVKSNSPTASQGAERPTRTLTKTAAVKTRQKSG